MPRHNGTRHDRPTGSATLCKRFGVPTPVTFIPAPLGAPRVSFIGGYRTTAAAPFPSIPRRTRRGGRR